MGGRVPSQVPTSRLDNRRVPPRVQPEPIARDDGRRESAAPPRDHRRSAEGGSDRVAAGRGRGLQHGPWRSLVDRRPDLAGELHPPRNGNLEPERLGLWSSERVWWRCARCGCEWQMTVMGRSAQGGGCPDCGPRVAAEVRRHGPRRPRWERSLAALRPDLVDELHPTRNDGLDAGTIGVWSRRRVWWRCSECAHEWETTVMNRQQGNGCPRCADARRSATFERNRGEGA
jgi:DNA-directed RNA polymerase subunit RPC12/RpoP